MTVPQFEEAWDFSGNIANDSNWDVELGSSTDTLDADGDAVITPNGDDWETYVGVYQTATDSIDQCVAIEVKNHGGDNNTYGAVLRQSNADGSGNWYAVSVRWSESTWEFSVERFAANTHQETIGTRINITTPNDGDWLGFAVTGTGNDTVFSYWDFGASDPGDFSTWGTATQTQTANPSTALDTGSYVGLYFYYSGSGASVVHEIDTWRGGDQVSSSSSSSSESVSSSSSSSSESVSSSSSSSSESVSSSSSSSSESVSSSSSSESFSSSSSSSADADTTILQNGFIDHFTALDDTNFAEVTGGSGSINFTDSYADLNCPSTSDSAFLYYKTKISKTKNSIFRICVRVQSDSAIPDVLGIYRDTGAAPDVDTTSNIDDDEFLCGLSITDASSPYQAFRRLTGTGPSTFSTDNLNTTDAPNVGATEDFYILGIEIDGDNAKMRGHIQHLATSQFSHTNAGLTLADVTAWADIPTISETEFYVCIGNRYSNAYADRYHVEWAYHEEVTDKVHGWVNSTSTGGTYNLRHMIGYGTQFMPEDEGAAAIAIAKGAAGTWTDEGYRGKFIIKDGSTYYMFVEGWAETYGADGKIGVWTATSPDGPWTPDGSNPILDPDTIIGSGYIDLTTMWVIKDWSESDSNWRWKMLIGATKASYSPLLFLLYSSSPTSGWTKYTGSGTDGSVYEKSGSGWRQDGVNDMAITWDSNDANWKMFIGGYESGEGWKVGLVESSDWKSWSVPNGVSNPIITDSSIRDDVVSISGKEITVDDGSIYTKDAALVLTDGSNVQYSRIRKITGNVLELYHEISGVTTSTDIEQVGEASVTPMYIEYQSNISKWVLTCTVFQPFIRGAGMESSELVGRYTADSLTGTFTQDYLNTLIVPRENTTSGAHESNENLRLVTEPFGASSSSSSSESVSSSSSSSSFSSSSSSESVSSSSSSESISSSSSSSSESISSSSSSSESVSSSSSSESISSSSSSSSESISSSSSSSESVSSSSSSSAESYSSSSSSFSSSSSSSQSVSSSSSSLSSESVSSSSSSESVSSSSSSESSSSSSSSESVSLSSSSSSLSSSSSSQSSSSSSSESVSSSSSSESSSSLSESSSSSSSESVSSSSSSFSSSSSSSESVSSSSSSFSSSSFSSSSSSFSSSSFSSSSSSSNAALPKYVTVAFSSKEPSTTFSSKKPTTTITGAP